MSVALAHHWIVSMRGGEKVLEEFCRLFPDAAIYTLVARPERLSDEIRRHRIIMSPLGRIAGIRRYYKQALPLFPLIVGAMAVEGRPEMVLTGDASMIKGISI